MKPWELELGNFYEIVDTLNATGERGTWLVYDKIGKRVCVLKKRDGTARDIYEKLRDAKNPHIPEIYRLMEHEGELLVIEEYIEGRTVAEILRYEERLPEKNVIQLLGGLCSCLKLLHRENIIHRDIKPANIIIAREGAVKLIDFGIARQQKEAEEKDTEPLGTRGYAPPEQYGFGQTDARSDIYSLGITLQRMLGRDYRGSLQKVIRRCTALDPADRYASVEELWQDVGEQRKKRRLRWIFGMAAGVIMAVACILWLGNRAPESSGMEENVETIQPQEASDVSEKVAPVGAEKQEKLQEVEPESKPITAPPQVPLPEPAADSEPKAFRYPFLVRSQCAFYLNGSPCEEGVAIPAEVWQKWEREGESVVFPSDWELTLHIDNDSAKDFANPTLEVSCRGASESSQSQSLPTIHSGSTRNVVIPLGGQTISGRIFMLGIRLEEAGGESMYWNFQFYLE